YELRDRVLERYNVELLRYAPELSVAEQAVVHGPNLWASDPGLCCRLRKVEPLKRALAELDAWITGIRREQTPHRANAGVVEWDARFGLVKINPLARWTAAEVERYLRERDVPRHPLYALGYPSIGCMPCTAPVAPGEDPRAGRWRGFTKTECGLHADE
ncbi:MAG TPA: phosphoadenylyl-sulfate reductase, partial [Bacillota bacterium]